MILQGEKVSLRPIRESDFDRFFKWHSDNEIRFQTVMHPYPVTEKMEKVWFDKAVNDSSNNRVIYVIEESASKNAIGYFQLIEINYISKNAKLGIVIGEKEWQGKGLGKEIMDLGLKYGFDYLNLSKISLDVVSSNKNAVKLYIKLGFIEEGCLKNHFYFNRKFHDIIIMSLLKEDYIEQKG